jgi:putative hydrolase of the HAD superfamily
MIRSIILDLGRVLVPFDFGRGYARMSERTGLAPGEIRSRIAASGLVPQLESGRIGDEEFVSRVTAMMGVQMGMTEFSEFWSSIFLPETLIPEEWVRNLRTRYRTVLLSNTNGIHYAMLRAKYSILEHFDAYVLSHEVGAMKPDPKIYAAAIEAAQARPEECFFTDDVAEFVEGARAAGIDAVHFVDAAKLRADLGARGVTW